MDKEEMAVTTAKNGFFKRNKGVFGFVIIIAMMVGLFFQNGTVGEKLDKYLANTEISFHEIYDDTKVIEAYKNGTTEGLNEEEKFLVDTLNEVIPEITTEDMTLFEKEKAAYDWVFGLTHLSEESLNPMNGGNSEVNDYTPYGVIKGHSAICVGNATTFKLMMDALDIPCKIVHSTEAGEHAWDVVQLDDEWYHVDVTFDGGETRPTYSNFNVPDSMKDTGSWPYDHNEIPACRGTKYCYLFMNAKEVKNMYRIPGAIAEARDAGEDYVAVTVKDTKGLTSTIAQYIANNIMVNDGEITFDGVYAADGKTLLLYRISWWNENNQDIIPDDVMEKFSKRFDKVNEGIMNSGDPYYYGEGDYVGNGAMG